MKAYSAFFLTGIFMINALSIAAELPDPRFIEAQKFESENRFDEAEKIYLDLYENQRLDTYFWRLINLYERTSDFEGMEKLTLSKLRGDPSNISAQRYLSRSLYGQGQRESGRNTLYDIINGRLGDSNMVKFIAEELVIQSEHDEAASLYIRAREFTGNDSIYAVELAQIYIFQENHIRTIEEYLKSLGSAAIIFVNIENEIDRALEAGGNPGELSQPFEDFLREHPDNLDAARLFSWLLYKTGNFNRACRVLIEPAVKADNPESVWNLAERFERDGNKDSALEVYQDYYRYFEKVPNRVEALNKTASIRTELGDREGAVDDYQIIMETYSGTVHAAFAGLRLLELSRDRASAEGYVKLLEEFAATTKFREVSYSAYLLLGETLMQSGRLDEARSALNNARVTARNNAEVYTVSVQYALLNFFAGETDAMTTNIEICVRSRSDGEEINELLEYKILGLKCSSPVEIEGFSKFSQGQYALLRGATDEAVEHFTAAMEDSSSVVAPYAASALGKLFESQGYFPEAVQWYLFAAEASQDTTIHIEAMMDAADIAVTKLGSTEQAKSLYLEAMTSFPGSVYENELRNRLRILVEQ